ncbi:unnamed protein product [Colias eurytheme]|nr:unnamed protein product [Colias eurytheme]
MSSISSSKEVKSFENSNKEFLLLEKTCEAFKDSDEEIKMIFNEIKKLSHNKETEMGDDEDVEMILKRAEDIANETENLLKSSPVAVNNVISYSGDSSIPDIKVTKPSVEPHKENDKSSNGKVRKTTH